MSFGAYFYELYGFNAPDLGVRDAGSNIWGLQRKGSTNKITV